MEKLKEGGVTSWEILKEVADQGYSDGLSILKLIETIERSNKPLLLEKLEENGIAEVNFLLRYAALISIHIIVVRAFSLSIRTDDLHLRPAIDFLRHRLDEAKNEGCCGTNLAEAIKLFDVADKDPRLPILRHMRNKELAHLARYGDTVKRSTYNELFGFCRDTSKIWEELSAGLVFVDLIDPMDDEINEYREVADTFWSKWE